jgi:outer membrane protein assembly factor BamB
MVRAGTHRPEGAMRRSPLLAMIVGLGLSAIAGAEDWPQFRGPRGDGTSTAAGLPIAWDKTRNIRWQTAVPGLGRSSPVIVGDRIWLTVADDAPAPAEQALAKLLESPDAARMYVAARVTLKLVCLDRADGRIVSTTTLFELANPDPIHKLNSFATPTPVVEDGRIYCDFGSSGTACVDASNLRVLWTQQRLTCEHLLGAGSSPALCGDRLIVVRDGCDAQYVAALEKSTGKVAWKTKRPPVDVESRYEKKSYSTPLVVECGGRKQAVIPGPHWVCGYDPATGRELWRIRHGRGFSLAPRPVYGNGLVYVCTGCMAPELWAIRLDGRGDVTETHVAWRSKHSVPMMSSPLLVGREIYFVSDEGVVSCLNAIDGKLLWRQRIGGNQLASPLFAEGRLYFFDFDGKATVLAAGTTYAKLAENQLEGPLVATPAVAGDAIYLRTDSRLYCIAHRGGGARMSEKRKTVDQRHEKP